MRIPTRPGNNIVDILKTTINAGARINIDQIAAVGKATLIAVMLGTAMLTTGARAKRLVVAAAAVLVTTPPANGGA